MNLSRRARLVGACAGIAVLSAAAESAAAEPPANVTAFFAKHCVECHGAVRPKGKVRLDAPPTDFDRPATRAHWQLVLQQVQTGEMPPQGKPRPMAGESKALADWLHAQFQAVRVRNGRVVLRRLNRVEYENTIRDLLGVAVDVKDLLPEDSQAHGFDNVGEALHISSFLLERYLEAADKALSVAIANGPQPPVVKKQYLLKDERPVKNATERVFLARDDALVSFTSSPWQALTLWQFYPPDRGTYRFRLSVSGHQSAGKPVVFRVDAGPMLMATKSQFIGYFDAPADKPAVVEFTVRQEARSTIRILPYGLASAQAVHKTGAENFAGPGLAVQWVEVEGPLHDAWPPASHRALFGALPQAPAPVVNNRSRVEVVSQEPEADAERILRAFARRAFRRNVTGEDVKPFLTLTKAKLAEKRSFEQAVRVGLTAVLASPEFLFLRERAAPDGKLDDFALASRLSYFLWSTQPDEELLTLAARGALSKPDVLRQQVERLLKHPKAAAFTENFVDQWLNLRDIDFTLPSHILYPEFDDMLKASMVQETHRFFTEVLTHDLSLTNFIASDFSMLNGRLARHYGIPGVEGFAFRKVALPPDSHRGGVLTMASVLKVTANGTSTSPVLRGAFVLERILGTPPPRPPADVPAVEPDIRGATTIREQLAKHRQFADCAACHAKIDPPGFALESFDVIGGWRENYRTSGRGEPVMLDGRRMPYLKGPKVDPADKMPDGRPFKDVDEFKQLLLRDKDQVARALTAKLLTYATGGAPDALDEAEVEAIVRQSADKNYGLRTLVHALVQSKLFQHK